MDITPYLGTIVTVLIAVGSVYAAISSRLARLETQIEHLRLEVEKHNHLIERTYKLEQDVVNLYHRYGEVRDGLNHMKDKEGKK